MNLKEILKGVSIKNIIGNRDKNITGIAINSKKVKNGYLFCAIPGFKRDGHDFILEAISNGASAVFLQKDNLDFLNGEIGILKNKKKKNNKEDIKDKNTNRIDASNKKFNEVCFIFAEDTRKELAIISKNFYQNPTSKLLLCGVTGTNGKTTTVFLINSIFKTAGYKTSYITTVEAQINNEVLHFERTTPESLELNDFFYNSILNGVECSSMEVSSHSIDLYRVNFLDFDYFVFTNLTQDHLDYHQTMENYFNVKSKLFLPEFRNIFNGKGAVINLDDAYGKIIASKTDLNVLGYSIKNPKSDIFASNIINSIDGIKMDIVLNNNFKKIHLNAALCGKFNVYNILAAFGIGIFCKINIKDIIDGISRMQGVKGRFEKFIIKGRYVIVDYAHTPDSLKNVLETARELLPSKEAKIICVFGCGGDRDKIKRKIMGRISAINADFSFITSDNPRSEDPEEIIDMIEEGFNELNLKNYSRIVDRREAIFAALSFAKEGDIIVIAGKGHEDYQEFADSKIHFSDQEVILEWC